MTSAVRIRILLAALVAVFAVAAPAVADESSKEGYGGIGGDVLTDIGGRSAPTAKAKTPSGGVESAPSAPAPSGAAIGATKTESDQLPFTGLDLGLLLGVGLLLVLSGAALRRLSDGERRSTV